MWYVLWRGMARAARKMSCAPGPSSALWAFLTPIVCRIPGALPSRAQHSHSTAHFSKACVLCSICVLCCCAVFVCCCVLCCCVLLRVVFLMFCGMCLCCSSVACLLAVGRVLALLQRTYSLGDHATLRCFRPSPALGGRSLSLRFSLAFPLSLLLPFSPSP